MCQDERIITIGRAPDNDIILNDSSVSRSHARLSLMPGGRLFLVDCTSANGTWLLHGGKAYPIRQDYITSYDTVRFGDLEITANELLRRIPPPPMPVTPVAVAEEPEWNPDTRRVRCSCGAIKTEGARCEQCGR